jgi:hypothetical protein
MRDQSFLDPCLSQQDDSCIPKLLRAFGYPVDIGLQLSNLHRLFLKFARRDLDFLLTPLGFLMCSLSFGARFSNLLAAFQQLLPVAAI